LTVALSLNAHEFDQHGFRDDSLDAHVTELWTTARSRNDDDFHFAEFYSRRRSTEQRGFFAL
jgi:hypothetical protein